MFGPIPSANTYFRDYGCRRLYGTPVSLVRNVKKTPLGFVEGARFTDASFNKANYQGLKLPYTTSLNVLRTSLGPYYVPIIKLPYKGLADNLFAGTALNGVMSGAHDITALTARAGDIFGTVNSDAHLYISPNIVGLASSLFAGVNSNSYIFTPRYMQATATGISCGDTSAARLARVVSLAPTAVLFDASTTSTAYLYTYNFTVGTMKSAASLAW